MNLAKYLFLLLIAGLTACLSEPVLYESDAYTVYPNKVKQGDYSAVVKSDAHLVSNYESLESQRFYPLIQFKFSINGGDNEMGYNQDHQANIFPDGEDSVVLDVTFGEKANLRREVADVGSVPPNTPVTFRVDFKPVLKAFETKGFYEDPHGNKIFKEDFKGLFIAGSAYPMSWDFENLMNNPQAKLSDDDNDGIYDITLVFNDYDPSAHVSSEWTPANDISKYPSFTGSIPLLNAIYNLSLDELEKLKEEDGTFRTGKEWSGVWTRDVSYSVYLSLAMLEPEMSKTSLMRKVKNNRIIQDTGTGGAWPVSSDRVVWALAAWEIYKYTGDKDWLCDAYEIISNTISDDEKTVFNKAYGLYSGESSFLDWRKQTYPLWMEPTDIYASMNLGTNMVFYQTLNILDQMAGELKINDTGWKQKAGKLKQSINENFWIPEKGYYGQFLYGDRYFSLSQKSETLGEALGVLFEVADQEQRSQIQANVPNLEYGTPCVWPQVPNIPPYHNNGIWPFVQAYWTLAAAKEKHTDLVQYGYASLLRPAALFLTNKENFVAETGDFAGTEINSDWQQWSVAGQLAMNYRVLFGMNLGANTLSFSPVIPESFSGVYHLEDFPYRNAVLHIKVEGFGDEVKEFYFDDVPQNEHAIGAGLTGKHTIKMVMNNQVQRHDFNRSDFMVSPETPVATFSDGQLSWHSVGEKVTYQIFCNGKMVSETSNTNFEAESYETGSVFQVLAKTGNGLESFLSEPVFYPGNNSLILEAEDFNLTTQSKFPGFEEDGYVEFSMKQNDRLRFSVSTHESGNWFLSFRYANGSGPVNTDNKCGIRTLFVNGEFASSLVFPQRGKDEWANWGITNTIEVELREGKNQIEIGFESYNENMNGDVNQFFLDQIIMEKK